MILGGSWWKSIKDYWKFGPEEDFYWNLSTNQYYPFEDLGNGLYYLRYRPVLFFESLIALGAVITLTILFHTLVGNYPLPTFMCVVGIFFGLNMLYGNMCTRELIISRMAGYVMRVQANKKVLAEQEIYNVYIRLQRCADSLNEYHYFITVGGYLLDDIQLSRYGANEQIMRQLGRRLARNLGLNYFDYEDISAKHLIYHYKGYSRRLWQRADLASLFAVPWEYDVEEEKELQENRALRKRVMDREAREEAKRRSTIFHDLRRGSETGVPGRRRSSIMENIKPRHPQ